MEKYFNMIVVDDETYVLDCFGTKFNWNKLGFQCIGQFDDAQDAIDFIDENCVDVVFTDIKMNGINGIDIAEYLHRIHKDIRVVFVSGSDEFQYAQKAIQYKVFDYLLKPCTYADIETVFSRLYQELEFEKHQKEYVQIGHRQFFLDAANGYVNFGTEKAQIFLRQSLNFKSTDPLFAIIYINIIQYYDYIKNSYVHDEHMFNNVIDNMLRNELFYTTVFNSSDGYFEVVAVTEETDKEKFQLQLQEIIEMARTNMKEVMEMDCRIEISAIEHMVNFAKTYRESESSLPNNKYVVEKIIYYISQCDSYNTLISIDRFFYKTNSEQQWRDACFKLLREISKRFETIINRHTLKTPELGKSATFHDAKEKIFSFCEKLMEKIRVDKTTEISPIELAKQYIEDNIYNDISLDSISTYVALSPSYFSRVFKQKMGLGLNEYVSKRKIEEAQKMLEFSDKKVVEIADILNYHNIGYFMKLFKQRVGCTPIEYRNRVKGD